MHDKRQPISDQQLDDRLAGLPRSMAPKRDLWPGIALRLSSPPREQSRRAAWAVPIALAASVLVAVVAARWVLERPAGQAVGDGSTPTVADAGPGDAEHLPPAAWNQGTSNLTALRVSSMVDQEFAGALHEYRRFAGGAISNKLSHLPQATVAEIEVAFWQFEHAARQIRDALNEDPENIYLAHMLSANHARQLRLLKQMADWAV